MTVVWWLSKACRMDTKMRNLQVHQWKILVSMK